MRKRTVSLSGGSRSEEPQAPIELVEHARPDLGVTEEVHLAVGRDRARLHLADVVEERRPPELESRDGLPHDLLRVLPDVLVAPLAVAEAHHRVHLGEDGRQRAHLEQLVEPALRVFAHDDPVEPIAHGSRIELHRRPEVFDPHHLDGAALRVALGGHRGRLERVKYGLARRGWG